MFRASARTAGLFAGILALMTLAGCAHSYPMDTLSTGSDYAKTIHSVYVMVNWIDLVILLIVIATMFMAIFWFSTRFGEPGEPSTVSSDLRLEIAWTAIPAIILIFISVPTVRAIWRTQPDKWPTDAVTVKVVAHQWWWEFQYPKLGIDTADELHIPVNREIHFELVSADVIHSFWIPAMGGKRDIIPGQVNEMTFTAHKTGEFYGQCVEFCGVSHANMRFRAFVDTKAGFAKWVKAQQAPPVEPTSGPAAAGAKIFANAPCAICHKINGISGFSKQYKGGYKGPNLTHFGSRTTLAGSIMANTPHNVAMWIQNPDKIKPGAKMPALGIQGKDLADLVAYLESLK